MTSTCEGIKGPLRNALRFLTQPEDILEFDATIRELMAVTQRVLDGDDMDEEMEGPVGFNAPLDGVEDWSEGTEELKDVTEDGLYTLLGLPAKTIPFFNKFEDPDGLHDIWEDRAWFKNNQQKCTELRPRWHQLIGMYKMLRNIFDNKPTLLMDEVGLGKTIQVVGVISLLASYFSAWENPTTPQRFPGDFGKCKHLDFISG